MLSYFVRIPEKINNIYKDGRWRIRCTIKKKRIYAVTLKNKEEMERGSAQALTQGPHLSDHSHFSSDILSVVLSILDCQMRAVSSYHLSPGMDIFKIKNKISTQFFYRIRNPTFAVSLITHPTYSGVWERQILWSAVKRLQIKGLFLVESDDFGERCCMVLAVHFTFTMKREQ